MRRQFKNNQETTECGLPSSIEKNGGQQQSCLDTLLQDIDTGSDRALAASVSLSSSKLMLSNTHLALQTPQKNTW
ncbi:hypothetical protein PoB_001217000 [Plakobranchus ocellatus]|uniref:Uncharacterized protein n=1 Tax=Plakobranchus ocellatus TaxID=259542 RepID=A0AAV3YSB9_9GAST|nr:hypothetical protein PoB_001217000 [Plakobranchus ocellatus]